MNSAMDTGSPLLPLIGVSLVLFGLVGIVVFVFLKLRRAARQESKPERLSEEAFAAAMIQSALAGRPTPSGVLAPPAGVAAAVPAADQSLIDALPIAVIVVDEAGVVRRVNAAARADLGLGVAATGHPFRSVLAPWPELIDAIARAQAGGAVISVEVEGLADGPRPARAARWAPGATRGGVVAVIGPAAGAAARSPAPTPVADVTTLAGGLAHELANSLTTIHGYAHLVNQDALSAADRSAMEQIKISGEAMLTTIEAFRALVRPLRLSPEPFQPEHAVEDAIKLARQDAKAESIVHFATAPCALVMGDRVVIEEAIAAVVQNAIEAQAAAPAAAPATVRVAPASGGGVDVVVTDHGPGVLPELRRRLCQPFFSDKAGHPGLGLAHACHILRAHDGAAIAFHHPDTGGLVVTIHLPPAA
jgi:signal transduction histidine kinase